MAKKSKTKAAKAPKAAKALKAPKTKRTAPGAAAVQDAAPKDKRTANQVRKGFLDHRTAWISWRAKMTVVEKLGKEVKAALKGDGYKVIQMQIADDLSGSPKAEAKIQTQVEDRLQVARWINHPLGAQMDLFSQPDRTPSVDRAFDAGLQASMENKPCKPPHSPETEQYRKWIAGWQEHQAEISKGFKTTKKNGGNGNGGAKDEPATEPEPVTSGERVSRSEFKERMSTMTAQEADGSPAIKH